MNALTLSQPWATLMIAPCREPYGRAIDAPIGQPIKRIESQSWHVKGGNQRIGIHAAKSINAGVRRAVSNGVVLREPYASALVSCGYSAFDPWHRNYDVRVAEAGELKPLPRGALIGLATIGRIVPGNVVCQWHKRGAISDLEFALGHYDEAEGPRYGWGAIEATPIEPPIETRGYQQLWQIPPDIERAIAELSAGADR
jgi:NOL1/NOP2/fmu family ribosome biogenesis protein